MIAHFTRMAMKAFVRYRLHTVVSLMSLTFGFLCFMSAVLLSNYMGSFDQHFPNADRIYNLVMVNKSGAGPDRFPIVNEPAARYLRTYFPEIPNIVRTNTGNPEDVAVGDRAFQLDTRYVEERFFDIFPIETLHGLETGSPLPPNSVLITETAAQRLYGRTDVVGERLLLDNRSDLVIAGVTAEFEEPSHMNFGVSLFNVELFVPMDIQDQAIRERLISQGIDPDADRWGNQSDYVFLEIPEDLPFDEEEFARRLDQFALDSMPEDRSEVQSFDIIPVNSLITTTMAFITGGFDMTQVLIFAGALVLMIGCLNYSNLVIAQLSLRSHEIAVQKIMGSKRSMLIAQYCYESFLFVCISLIISTIVFYFLLNALQATGLKGLSPSLLLDADLWLPLAQVVVVIILIAGGYPALRTAIVPLIRMMRPKGSSGYSGRLRALMVGVQFFISGTLMILAIIMYSQNQALVQELDGAIADPKIVINTMTDTYQVEPELVATELLRHPAILAVTQVDTPPWNISNSSTGFTRSPGLNEDTVELSYHNVGYNYTDVMDMEVIAGREFEREPTNDHFPDYPSLTPSSGPFAAIIDDRGAQSLGWESATDAIGGTIYRRLGPPLVENRMEIELQIVGAMEKPHYQFIDFGAFGSQGNIFFLRPESARYMALKLDRNRLNEGLQHLEDTWQQLMPTVPLQREFFDDLFYSAYALFASIGWSIGALSVMGFLIASIGLLGNATFITNIRRREVGIRKVMGASSGRLLRLLLLDFAKPILIANALAWPLGYIIGSSYVSLFAVRAEVNAAPFILSLSLSVLIAVSAVISQSWKSSRVRPAMVLRYE